MLHGIHGIQSHCMESTAFKWHAFYQAAWNPLHSIMLPVIHCIQSGCILPGCMKSTAFNPAAWNPLHSIGMHFTRMHGIHCIQSQYMESTAFNRDAFYQAACITLHSTRCKESTAFNDAAWNPLHSIGMLLAMLHKVHCIQSCSKESTASNRHGFGHAA